MILFRKSRPQSPSPVKEKVARSIAQRLVNLQLRAAKWLHHWQARISIKKRNLILIALAILWFVYCIYILIAAIIE